ncbi:MAG: hypothetical protein HC818_04250 [Synechococcaceae cyanobacterium RM1_1_27]|nr:hypothetical protein [Synechococcaceae cyanobacterium RM1_1_27]
MIRIPRFSILALLLLSGGLLAQMTQVAEAQESITVPVDVTITSPVGVNVTIILPFDEPALSFPPTRPIPLPPSPLPWVAASL